MTDTKQMSETKPATSPPVSSLGPTQDEGEGKSRNEGSASGSNGRQWSNNNWDGWGPLIGSRALWGLLPLVIVLSSGHDAPFLFMALWSLGGLFACIWWCFRKKVREVGMKELRGFLRLGKGFWKIEDNFYDYREIKELTDDLHRVQDGNVHKNREGNNIDDKEEHYKEHEGNNTNKHANWNWQVYLSTIIRQLFVAFLAWSLLYIPIFSSLLIVESWVVFSSFAFLLLPSIWHGLKYFFAQILFMNKKLIFKKTDRKLREYKKSIFSIANDIIYDNGKNEYNFGEKINYEIVRKEIPRVEANNWTNRTIANQIIHNVSKSEDKTNWVRNLIFIALAFGGIIFLALSGSIGSNLSLPLVGLLLLVIAILCISIEDMPYNWARLVGRRRAFKEKYLGNLGKDGESEKNELYDRELGYISKYLVFNRGVSLLFGVVIGLLVHYTELFGLIDSLGFDAFTNLGFMHFTDSLWVYVVVFVAGAVVELFGPLCKMESRYWNEKIRKDRIEFLRTLTPVFSVTYLVLFWLIALLFTGNWFANDWFTGDSIAVLNNDIRYEFIILGGIAVVVSNILLNSQGEDKTGLAVLVAGLWGATAFVWLRDGMLGIWLGENRWLLEGDTYFAVVALSATAFTLLLAFRINRITARTNEEEKLVYSLISRFDWLAVHHKEINDIKVRKGGDPIHPKVKHALSGHECIEIIDDPKDTDVLKDAYFRLRLQLDGYLNKRVRSGSGGLDKDTKKEVEKYILETQVELDTLAHSKQYGREYGETSAVLILGVLTASIALLTRPATEIDLAKFLFDSFTAIFAGTILFLSVHIFDLMLERKTSIIDSQERIGKNLGNGYAVIGEEYARSDKDAFFMVEFRTEDSKFSSKLFTGCTAAILAVSVTLLLEKWVIDLPFLN